MNSFSKEKLSMPSDMINNNASSQKYISLNDFIYFKNELLKDLKVIESKLIFKMDSLKKEIENKIINIENKYDLLKSKMFETNKPEQDFEKLYSDKINKLFIFKTNTEDKIFIHEKKIKEINDYSRESLYKFNKILQDNLLCPGIIGNNSKFSTFQNLIDYLLSNINLLNDFKEKMSILDMQNYKNKLDRLIQSFKIQIDNFIDSSKKLTTNTLIDFENKGIELYNTFDNKLMEVKNDLECKINLANEKIDDQKNLIYNIKNEIMHKINKNISENNNSFNNIDLKFEKYFNEIDNINKKYNEFNEKIKKINKDLEEKVKEQESKLIVKMSRLYKVIQDFNIEFNKKFKTLNLNNDVIQNNNFNFGEQFENNLNFVKNKEFDIPNIQLKSSHSVGSILKKYIDGEIGLNEFLQYSKDKKIKRKEDKIKLENNSINYLNTNINYINENYSSCKNIKYIKLNNKNETMNNNQDCIKNRLLIKKNKIDKAIINNENNLLNKVQRKEIIKTLLMENIEPFAYYLMKSKYDQKNPQIKLNNKSKTSRTKNNFLSRGKSGINLISKRFRNNSSYHFNKNDLPNDLFNTGGDIKNASNEEINNYQEINKKALSSLLVRSRNLDKNYFSVHNFTDTIKDSSKLLQNSQIKENTENKNSFESKKINTNNLNSLEPKIYNISFKNNFGLNNKNKVNVKLKISKKDVNYKLGNIKKGKNIKSSYIYLNNKIKKDK